MNVRKIVWLAFALVMLGFVGVVLLLLRTPQAPKAAVPAAVVPAVPQVQVQQTVPAAVSEPSEQVWLLAAKRDLIAGRFLTVDDFNWRQVNVEQRDKMIAPLEKGSDEPRSQIGGLLRKSVTAGTLLSSLDILKPGENGYLAALITPGMRAFSIEVSQSDASYRLVSPGDKVDVIMSAYLNGSEGGTFEDVQALRARTLVTNSRVLAVDDHATDVQLPVRVAEGKQDPKAVITLEVNQRDAERLSLATTLKARFSLSTRNLNQGAQELDVSSHDLSDIIPEVKLAGPEVGLVLMRGDALTFIGENKEKKEANEE
ncbi:MAG: Flp pilus assembly protein CpaB [Pseudomonadales bacterium]